MQPDTNDLLYAAHAALRALDDGPLYGHDRAALLLRCAVQACDLAILGATLDAAHAEIDTMREALAIARAEAETASTTIAALRIDLRDVRAANDTAMRTLPRREAAS